MQTVIIAGASDDHVPLVLPHLSVPHTLIEVQRIAEGEQTLTYEVVDGDMRVIYDGRLIEDVRSVWSKKLSITFGTEDKINPRYRAYCQGSWRQLVAALSVQFENALWVSPQHATPRANRKILQIAMARRVGFAVPETIQTSDPVAAKAFVDRHDATIVKPLVSEITPGVTGGGTYNFATKVQRGEKIQYKLLPLAPLIFQEAIEPAADIRVVVVGRTVFAARIDTDPSEGGVRDWRIAQYGGKLDIIPYELPAEVQAQCAQLIKNLGLAFGAIDLILDKKGQLWFLENNTTGAWGFVERATNLPIGKELAKLLSSGTLADLE